MNAKEREAIRKHVIDSGPNVDLSRLQLLHDLGMSREEAREMLVAAGLLALARARHGGDGEAVLDSILDESRYPDWSRS